MTSDADSKAGFSRIDSCSQPATGPLDRAAPGALDPGALAKVAPDNDALFLDVDGTLLPIADHPDAVRVQPALLTTLEHLFGRFGGALALISGRGIADLDALFAPLRLPSAGVHGMERRSVDGRVHSDDATLWLAPLRAPLAAFVQRHDGLLLEDKRQSLALHFRKAPGCAAEAEALLLRLIAASPTALELKRGKMVLEVTPGTADKGTAIAAFMQEAPFSGRRPVFIGDDVTDEDGFAAVNAMGGLSIRVGNPDAPTAARLCLPDEAAVLAWLQRWSEGSGAGERG